jgi:signal transduction histidine kinase
LHEFHLDGRAHDPEAFVWILRDHTQQALAEEARDRFVGAATHELRTPLADILAYSETLANAEMDADSQRVVLQYDFFRSVAIKSSAGSIAQSATDGSWLFDHRPRSMRCLAID